MLLCSEVTNFSTNHKISLGINRYYLKKLMIHDQKSVVRELKTPFHAFRNQSLRLKGDRPSITSEPRYVA